MFRRYLTITKGENTVYLFLDAIKKIEKTESRIRIYYDNISAVGHGLCTEILSKGYIEVFATGMRKGSNIEEDNNTLISFLLGHSYADSLMTITDYDYFID